jgi:alginate O-acetyltransferase complex protein AlgI
MDFIKDRIIEIFSYTPGNPMIFNSGYFFIFFLLFISIYAFIFKNRKTVTIYVIAFSLFFYYKSSGLYFILLILTAITDYWFALKIDKAGGKKIRRLWLTLSVGSSLGLLVFFKYSNFIIANLINLLKYIGADSWVSAIAQSGDRPFFSSMESVIANNFQPFDIFLPIGISFYTFQSISYVADVYTKKLKPEKNFLDYFFFLSFFPQLVAGPIVKANLFLPQLKKKIVLKKEVIWMGVWLILLGLFKKAVIADYIAQYNDFVFLSPYTYSGFETLMAVIGYTLQIYCDFSGYSDMAIGLGMIMGFDLGINFNFPYKAINITDFWRRWHISLSSWLRDYLYIPLGGNRKGKLKMYRNLFLTMFLGGLWHGANWKFVVWGSLHGIALAIHKALKPKLDLLPKAKSLRLVSWFFTFVFVMTLWIFFRAADVSEAYSEHKIKGGKDCEYYTQIAERTDSTFSVRLIYCGEKLKQDTLTTTLAVKSSTKIRIKEKIKGEDKILSVHAMIPAHKVAFYMIKKIILETDLSKYSFAFYEAHSLWVLLLLIGFLMHFAPQRLTDFVSANFVRLPLILKLIVFMVVVQLVVQFKNADVVPFIYFQF